MKSAGLIGVVLGLALLCCVSCKSKQKAYKAAYEQAKENEVVDYSVPAEEEEEIIEPVSKSKTATPPARQERISAIAGENANGIKLYSVVIGSFKNQTNAYSLKERMQAEGYMPILGENEQGMLRVILTSHETRQEAAQSREAVRSKYYPNFQDAWILERRY